MDYDKLIEIVEQRTDELNKIENSGTLKPGYNIIRRENDILYAIISRFKEIKEL